MKQYYSKLLLFVFLGCSFLNINETKAQCVTGTEITKTYPKRDLRGVFVASVVSIDWPKDRNATPAVQQAELITILDNIRTNGYNTVYLQVRPECDALYASTIEPWSYWLTGTQGVAPNPIWDPLQFAITEAHARGLDLHAWLNPYRAQRLTTSYTAAASHVVNTNPSWILTSSSGTLKILDPGLPAVKNYIVSVIEDIASRYDLDGIHFDDYFYPSGGMTAAPNNQDKTTFANNNPGGLTLENWRRDNVNKMITSVYDAIQTINTTKNKNIIFGVSPFGIWKSGTPAGITGTSSYDALFCDPIAWLNSGKIDYLAPQLYWKITGAQDYIALSKWWNDQIKLKSKQLYVSQGYYKMDDANAWPITEIQNQINQNRVANMDATFGQIAYSYTAIKNNLKGLNGALNSTQFKYKSFAPPITGTGKDAVCPTKPDNIRFGPLKIQWDTPAAASDGDLPVKYVVYAFANAAEAITNKNDGSKIIDIVAGNEVALTQSQIDTKFFVVTSLDKNNNEAGDFSAASWNGIVDTSWTNAGNWSLGVIPISTSNVTISGTNQPIITSNVSIKSLTINSGKSLKLNSDFNLTVTDGIVNAGTLTIENNANLIQTNAVANTGTGNTIVKRNSNALSRLDYTLWSSPVGGQKLDLFSPLTSPTRFHTYNPSTNVYNSVVNPATTNFSIGTGYLIRMPNTAVTAPATQVFNGVFTGTPNNGNVTLTVPNAKYNAVGNPYPSTISANTFIDTNLITEALYFWRKSNNAATTSYATYTKAGGTANAGGGSSIVPNGIIQIGQGFIYKSTSTSLNFTNAMRLANNVNQFLKTKATEEKSRIWLNLSNDTAPVNQMMVAYMTEATSGIDPTIDGRYFNDNPTALNSLVENEEFVIQGRGLPFDVSDIVPLSFKTTTAGSYTISIDHVDGLFTSEQDIILVDASNGTETDLRAGGYTFAAASGVDNARFSLKYQKTLATNSFIFDENSVVVYKNQSEIQIKSGATTIDNVKLFDLNGRLLSEKSEVNANEATIDCSRFANQVLIVQITSSDKKVVNKKLVN